MTSRDSTKNYVSPRPRLWARIKARGARGGYQMNGRVGPINWGNASPVPSRVVRSNSTPLCVGNIPPKGVLRHPSGQTFGRSCRQGDLCRSRAGYRLIVRFPQKGRSCAPNLAMGVTLGAQGKRPPFRYKPQHVLLNT
jgi:hypothetical protein